VEPLTCEKNPTGSYYVRERLNTLAPILGSHAARSSEHRGEPGGVGPVPAAAATASSAVMTSIVVERLCGSIPIMT
jgi:hypothetical protein